MIPIRPLAHALYSTQVPLAFGIEMDETKVEKSSTFLGLTLTKMEKEGFSRPPFPFLYCKSIEDIQSLDPATHAYSFWEGIPDASRCAFGHLFRDSSTLHTVVIVQRAIRKDPIKLMSALGFGQVELIDVINKVVMSGSTSSFQVCNTQSFL